MSPPPATLAAFFAALRTHPHDARAVDTLEARAQRVRGRTLRLPPRPALLLTSLVSPPPPPPALHLDLLTIAGGTVSPHAPEVVVLTLPGYHLPDAPATGTWLCTTFPSASDLFLADAALLTSPPGTLLVEALEVLACCLHPLHFPDLSERRAARFTRIR